ncbi:hypothetical protein Agub_g12631, partial [Astrephomene gubernaculifera]
GGRVPPQPQPSVQVEVGEWRSQWCPPQAALWSAHYRKHPRTPADLQLAPWVAERYSRRRRHDVARQSEELLLRRREEEGEGEDGGAGAATTAASAASVASAAAAAAASASASEDPGVTPTASGGAPAVGRDVGAHVVVSAAVGRDAGVVAAVLAAERLDEEVCDKGK